jgi:hypothetical protein
MNVLDYMKQMKRGSKSDDIPGTVEVISMEPCPSCGKFLKKYKACCGAKYGYLGCSCGYKVVLSGDSV